MIDKDLVWMLDGSTPTATTPHTFRESDIGTVRYFETPEALIDFVKRPHGPMTCPQCDGIGKTVAEDAEIIDCPDCHGSGRTLA